MTPQETQAFNQMQRVLEKAFNCLITPENADLRIVLRDIPLTLAAAKEVQPQAQKCIYQVKVYGSQSAWHDAGFSAYEVTPAKDRRIVYTKPSDIAYTK